MNARAVVLFAGFGLAIVAGALGITGVSSRAVASPAPSSHTSSVGLKHVPANVSDEMHQVVADCEHAETYAAYHDCSCIGDAYVKARLSGDQASPAQSHATAGTHVFGAAAGLGLSHAKISPQQQSSTPDPASRAAAEHRCVNPPGIVKYEYRRCTNNHQYDPEDFQPFCKCRANAMAREFVKSPPEVFDGNLTSLSHSAFEACQAEWPKK